MKKLSVLFILITSGLFLTGAGVLFADDDGFTSFANMDTASSLSWSGTGSVTTRYMISDYGSLDSILQSDVVLYPELAIKLEYQGDSTRFNGSFSLSGNYDFSNTGDVSTYLSSMVNEAYFTAFFGNMNFEAGLMKILWGKGDEIFTFDNINAVDYTDFMNGSYVDRKIPEIMLKVNIPFGEQGLVEALYTPVFTPDQFPTTGVWVQKDYTSMEAIINSELETYVTNRVTTLRSSGISDQQAAATIAQMEAAVLADNVLKAENTKTISHGQGGLRITDSFGGVDLGAAYEFTFLRDPVVDMSAFLQNPADKISVTYDRLNLFGVDAAAVLAGFNIRAEGAYYLTRDVKGTAPLVHNNKIQYLFGFDKNLPIHNVSMNIQARGEIKLSSDKIKENGLIDTDYSDNDSYSSQIIGADIRDTFFNDTLTVKASGAYSLGSKDYMIKPGIEYAIADGAVIKASYTLYRGEDNTVFGQFKDNDMLEVIFSYAF